MVVKTAQPPGIYTDYQAIGTRTISQVSSFIIQVFRILFTFFFFKDGLHTCTCILLMKERIYVIF